MGGVVGGVGGGQAMSLPFRVIQLGELARGVPIRLSAEFEKDRAAYFRRGATAGEGDLAALGRAMGRHAGTVVEKEDQRV